MTKAKECQPSPLTLKGSDRGVQLTIQVKLGKDEATSHQVTGSILQLQGHSAGKLTQVADVHSQLLQESEELPYLPPESLLTPWSLHTLQPSSAPSPTPSFTAIFLSFPSFLPYPLSLTSFWSHKDKQSTWKDGREYKTSFQEAEWLLYPELSLPWLRCPFTEGKLFGSVSCGLRFGGGVVGFFF